MSLSYVPRLPVSETEPDFAVAAPSGREITVTVEADIARLEQAWRDLETRAPGHVYQSFDWLSVWNGTIGAAAGVKPCVAVGRADDGRIVFILPLGIKRQTGAAVLVWLGGREADLKCGLFEPEFLSSLGAPRWSALWRRVLAELPRIDAIHFCDQPERLGAFAEDGAARRQDACNAPGQRVGKLLPRQAQLGGASARPAAAAPARSHGRAQIRDCERQQ
jgi:CelD/BcsL family acetyltransferase involved in cellulose biosynthesis